VWISLIVVSFLLGIPVVRIAREYHNHRCDLALLAAIKQNSIPDALAALRSGADPNCRVVRGEGYSFFSGVFAGLLEAVA